MKRSGTVTYILSEEEYIKLTRSLSVVEEYVSDALSHFLDEEGDVQHALKTMRTILLDEEETY